MFYLTEPANIRTVISDTGCGDGASGVHDSDPVGE